MTRLQPGDTPDSIAFIACAAGRKLAVSREKRQKNSFGEVVEVSKFYGLHAVD